MLPLLFDRLIRKLLQNKAIAKKQSITSSPDNLVRPLTVMESSAIRYMSSYAEVSLLKKYRKPTEQHQLKMKRTPIVNVLNGMKAVNQLGKMESVLNYIQGYGLTY